MSQLERVYRIERLLKARQAVPRSDLVAELEVSWATIKRDLEYMRSRMNAPVIWDRTRRGYRLERDYSLPGLHLEAPEICGLLVLQQLLGRTEPVFLGEHVDALRDLLRKALGDTRDSVEEAGRRIQIMHVRSRPVESTLFQVVSQATITRRRLDLHYYSRVRDAESRREVSPQRLIHYRDTWYLDAWCHLRNGLRNFALDAIRQAEILETQAVDIADHDLDSELGSGYGIFSSARTKTAVLRFEPETARWVANERWHPQQDGKFQPDGRYILSVPYAGERELVMDILRYGPEVEVLAPQELRASVQDALRRALQQYAP